MGTKQVKSKVQAAAFPWYNSLPRFPLQKKSSVWSEIKSEQNTTFFMLTAGLHHRGIKPAEEEQDTREVSFYLKGSFRKLFLTYRIIESVFTFEDLKLV